MTGTASEGLRQPFGNMRFRVEIDGLPGGAALEVIFPEARLSGQRGKRTVRFGSLIIKRGLTRSTDWYDWWDAARRAQRPPRRSLRVTLLDSGGRDASAWHFGDAAPVAYQLSPLNALGNEAVTETLELSVGSFAAYSGATAAPGRSRSRRRGAAG